MRAFLIFLSCLVAASAKPWMNVGATPSQRAKALLANMNMTEKINMLHGWSTPYVGGVPGNTRLGIPALNLNDGPQGFRTSTAYAGTTTQWPSGLTTAASWDRDNLKAWGTAMGQEFVGKGANVQLGPGVCLARVPLNGRNFEYLSGEDPYLGYALVQPAIEGIQSQGVIANAKHYILNNQETNRGNVSDNADERTIMEMYMPPFGGAVEAGVGSFMCSYNRINGVHACENNDTLATYLKTYVAKGNQSFWVMSDWGATHSTVPSAVSGLDQEMPSDRFFSEALLTAAIASGNITEAQIDDKVLRMLTPMFTAGLFDNQPTGSLTANVTSAAHNTLARQLAAGSAVLMKNNGILPLDKTKTIAVIGAQAESPITGGGGSGSVAPYYQASPLMSIAAVLNGGPLPPRPANCTLYPGTDFFQPGNPSVPATSTDECCAACAEHISCNAFAFVASDSVCWLKPNANGRRSDASVVAGTCPSASLPKGLTYNDGTSITAATTAAKSADVAIVFVATTSSEGSDRTNLSLPDNQDTLVASVADANPNTIVVIVTPGALLTPWSDASAAVVNFFMPGQEYGNAVTDVLFGAVNPSGKLPLTFPNVENEQQFTPSQYPGLPDPGTPLNSDYTEGLFVGYRWYNAHNVTPKFCFGHGLSYTKFAFSDLDVSGRDITVKIDNVGDVAGAEVVQLYVAFPASSREPPLQLKGFEKVSIAPGSSQDVTFSLTDRDLSVWDVTTHTWALQHGTFVAHVGAASCDLRTQAPFTA